MIKSLSSDFYKLRKSRAFWVCVITSVVMGLLVVFGIKQGMKMTEQEGGRQLLNMFANASGVWALANAMSEMLHLMVSGIFTAIFVAGEFTNGTMKNSLSRGTSRTNVFFSKSIVCVVSALLMMLLFMGTILLLGSMLWGFNTNGIATISGLLGMIGGQAMLTIGFTTLFVFITICIRGGGSIAINILCVVMGRLLFSLVGMLFDGSVNVVQLWLGDWVDRLATLSPSDSDVTQSIVVAVVWSVLSLGLGWILFQKQDIK